jgi:hypothetical protein
VNIFGQSRRQQQERAEKRRAKREDNARFIAQIKGEVLNPQRADIEAALDKLFSEWIRLRDEAGRCRICEVRPVEVCYHIIPRGAHSIRWSEDNAWGACGRCNSAEQQNRPHYKDLHRQIMGDVAYAQLVARSREIADWTTEQLTTLRDVLKHQIETFRR